SSDPVGHTSADASHLRRAGNADAVCEQCANRRFLFLAHTGPADGFTALRALDARPGDPGVDPLDDRGPLQLRELTGHLKHRPPHRCTGVDALLIEIEVDARRMDL